MDRALALANRGLAVAHPNPRVGAVIVKDGKVAGEGFHTYEGLKHAERIALERAGAKARGATLYLNLEPCCHFGRTGPCTDAIVAAGIAPSIENRFEPVWFSVASPALLFDELEVKRTQSSKGQLPEYPAPALGQAATQP